VFRQFCHLLIPVLAACVLVVQCAPFAHARGNNRGEKPMVLSLEQCIAMALSENDKLRAAGYDVAAAKGQLIEAKARWWPIFDYESYLAPVPRNVADAVSSFFSWNVAAWARVKIVLGIPMYAFGQLTMAGKLAEGGVIAAQHRVVREREKLIYDIKQIYYGILFGMEMEKLLGKAADALSNKISNEEDAEDPKHSPYKLLEMKVFREELEQQLDRTCVEMALAFAGLKLQMGLPPYVEVKLNRDALEPEVVDLSMAEDYVNASMEHRPDSKLIEIGVATKRRLWKLEKRKMAPKLGGAFYFDIGRTHKSITGLTATDDFNNPFNFTRAGIGLRLSGRLDFHGAYGRIKKKRAEYLKALYEGKMGKKGLALEARKTYDEAVKLKKKVMSARKSQSMANQMMFLSKTNFEMGIGEQEEYSNALKLVLGLRGKYFKSVFDYNCALANLEQKVGEERYAQLTGRPNIPVYEAFNVGHYEPEDEENGNNNDDEFIYEEGDQDETETVTE